MTYKEGDIVTIKDDITNRDIDMVGLGGNDPRGIQCRIRYYTPGIKQPTGQRDCATYNIVVVSEKYFNQYWWIPEDWVSLTRMPCMFGDIT